VVVQALRQDNVKVVAIHPGTDTHTYKCISYS